MTFSNMLTHARSAAEGEAGRRLIWPPLNVAHRGASGEAPENTLAAFDLALRQGARGIEFDVHLSSDGIPVVIHDPRLNRTTSGSGWVGEHRASALRKLDAGSWFNRRFPQKARRAYVGAKIPLLSEVLAWVQARQALAFIEIKRGKKAYPGIEAKVVDEIEQQRVGRLVTIVSFDFASLRRVQQLNRPIFLGLDVSRALLAIRRVRSLAGNAVLPHWAIASRGFIRRAHKHSIPVFPWTVDQPARMERKITEGVDGIITNYPARLAEVLRRQESEVRSHSVVRLAVAGRRDSTTSYPLLSPLLSEEGSGVVGRQAGRMVKGIGEKRKDEKNC